MMNFEHHGYWIVYMHGTFDIYSDGDCVNFGECITLDEAKDFIDRLERFYE